MKEGSICSLLWGYQGLAYRRRAVEGGKMFLNWIGGWGWLDVSHEAYLRGGGVKLKGIEVPGIDSIFESQCQNDIFPITFSCVIKKEEMYETFVN